MYLPLETRVLPALLLEYLKPFIHYKLSKIDWRKNMLFHVTATHSADNCPGYNWEFRLRWLRLDNVRWLEQIYGLIGGSCFLRNLRACFTASSIFFGVSFHGKIVVSALGASSATSIAVS